MIAAVKGQESRAFSYETDLRFALSYIKKTYEMHRGKLQGSTIEELARFGQALFRKKISSAARIVKRNP